MERTARAAARSDREVLLALLDASLLVAASDRMLEARRFVELPVMEISTSSCSMMARFLDGVSAVALDLCTLRIRAVLDLLDDVELARLEVVVRHDIREAVVRLMI